eukprot:TRINITY_DN220_c0_g1_i1.p1 TRINITY_DN220_c0_g1~~TRINITY_DN220_c0_g1_i1.p1  ORF type:complete len:187 (+),score=54.29 TRINITY_DN220_c0_g1_i1:42-563(+)
MQGFTAVAVVALLALSWSVAAQEVSAVAPRTLYSASVRNYMPDTVVEVTAVYKHGEGAGARVEVREPIQMYPKGSVFFSQKTFESEGTVLTYAIDSISVTSLTYENGEYKRGNTVTLTAPFEHINSPTKHALFRVLPDPSKAEDKNALTLEFATSPMHTTSRAAATAEDKAEV